MENNIYVLNNSCLQTADTKLPKHVKKVGPAARTRITDRFSVAHKKAQIKRFSGKEKDRETLGGGGGQDGHQNENKE